MAEKRKKAGVMQEDTKKTENRFLKEQLISSAHFWERRDIVNVLLNEEELYTIKDVEEKIQNYMKGEVK